MKLTGILKEKVEAVETKEEKKTIIAEAGMELTDDELDVVAGGHTKDRMGAGPQYMDIFCSCGVINRVDVSKNSYKCSKCGKVQEISG